MGAPRRRCGEPRPHCRTAAHSLTSRTSIRIAPGLALHRRPIVPGASSHPASFGVGGRWREGCEGQGGNTATVDACAGGERQCAAATRLALPPSRCTRATRGEKEVNEHCEPSPTPPPTGASPRSCTTRPNAVSSTPAGRLSRASPNAPGSPMTACAVATPHRDQSRCPRTGLRQVAEGLTPDLVPVPEGIDAGRRSRRMQRAMAVEPPGIARERPIGAAGAARTPWPPEHVGYEREEAGRREGGKPRSGCLHRHTLRIPRPRDA